MAIMILYYMKVLRLYYFEDRTTNSFFMTLRCQDFIFGRCVCTERGDHFSLELSHYNDELHYLVLGAHIL